MPNEVGAMLTQLPSVLAISIEGHYGDTKQNMYASVWVKGTQAFDWTANTLGAGTWNATVDVKAQETFTLRAKAESILSGQEGFARLTNLDGHYENIAALAQLSVVQKRWVRFPSTGADADLSSFLQELRTGTATWDDDFTVQTSKGAKGGTVYKLTLTPEAKTRFSASSNSYLDSMGGRAARLERRLAKSKDSDVAIKVEMNARNEFVSAKVYFFTKEGTSYGSVSVTATKATLPTLAPPANALSIEEFSNTFGSGFGDSLPSFGLPIISPTKQLQDARNAQRQSDVNTILNAVYQYMIDNNGNMPGTITTTSQEVCATSYNEKTGTSSSVTNGSCVDLELLTGMYLVTVPGDPQAPEGRTHYRIKKDKNGRITVTAPDAEGGVTISVTR